MLRLIFIACLLLPGALIFGQDWDLNPPDYDSIELRIAEDTSDLYYPKLMRDFREADTSLSLKEKRHLYYGYIFHEEYNPYGSSKFADSLNRILSGDTLLPGDYHRIRIFSDSVLTQYPFDLSVLNYKYFVYSVVKDQEAFRDNLTKISIILDAVMSSGDGLSKESAFWVINPGHEYDVLNVMGFEASGDEELEGQYDYLKLKDNEYGILGIYFNIKPCLEYLGVKLED